MAAVTESTTKPGLRGNRNALRNGTRSYLTTGRLPKGASWVSRLVRRFKAATEAAVRERDGEVSLFAAATIQTACRHEGRALLWQRWLREKQASLSVDQLLAVTREIGAASDARDRCLKALGLDKRQAIDPWDAIYNAKPNGTPQRPAVARADSDTGQPGQAAATERLDAAAGVVASE